MKQITKDFGSIQSKCFFLNGENASTKNAIIFLHGAGASMDDLIPLREHLPSTKNHDQYFLNAPFSMMPPLPMFIWFEVGELVEKMAETGFDEQIIKTFIPTRLQEGRNYLKEAMNKILTNHKSAYIIGFSQGGMMSLDYALTDEKISKIALLSTSLCDYQTLDANIKNVSPNIKIFQSHGIQDQVLPYEYGKYLANFLIEKNLQNEFISFQGGHEIPLEILNKLDGFLGR